MCPFSLECELCKPVCHYFKKRGYAIKREIRIGYCIADIVAYTTNHTIAIELKLRNWKKAIIQAKNYQLGADFVYLAFPLASAHTVLRKAEYVLKKEGIGLLVINEQSRKVSQIIKPRTSPRKLGEMVFKTSSCY